MKMISDYNFSEAVQFIKQGRYLHALQILTKLKQSHPEDCLLLLKIAELYEYLGKIDSISHLIEDYGKEKLTDEYLLQFAQMYIRNLRCEEGADLISYVNVSEYPEALYLKGQAYYSLEEFEISLINFKEFVKNSSSSDLVGEAYQYISECYIELGNFDEALQYAEKAESLTTLSPELYFILAKIYFFKDMQYHAKENISKAIKMNENNIEFKDLAGRILYKTGEYDKAEVFFKAFIEADSGNSDVLSLLGQSCLKQHKTDEALGFFTRSLKINPEDSIAKNGVEECGRQKVSI